MKRSRLLSKQFSINDVLYIPRNTKSSETSEQEEYQNRSQPVNTSRQLFKGLSFKRLGSLETVDADELLGQRMEPGFNSMPLISLENPLEYEKIRIKLQKTQKTEKTPKRIDPNRHLWQQQNEEKLTKKVMTLRHITEIQNKTAKLNALKISVIMSPKNG